MSEEALKELRKKLKKTGIDKEKSKKTYDKLLKKLEDEKKLKKSKGKLDGRGPYKGPDWKNLTEEEKHEQAKKYLLKSAEGGIVKRYKGGLMVAPKRAKRGY